MKGKETEERAERLWGIVRGKCCSLVKFNSRSKLVYCLRLPLFGILEICSQNVITVEIERDVYCRCRPLWLEQ